MTLTAADVIAARAAARQYRLEVRRLRLAQEAMRDISMAQILIDAWNSGA